MKVSITAVLITLNEAHHLANCLSQIASFCDEIIIVDSYSSDNTVDIALEYNALVYQKKFESFGDQWNAAISLAKRTNWVMKIDPDERFEDGFVEELKSLIRRSDINVISVPIHITWLGKKLPISYRLERVWMRGKAEFTLSKANEHLIYQGKATAMKRGLLHLDSPNIHHWINKQNHYSSRELEGTLAALKTELNPTLFGSYSQRLAWLKLKFYSMPFRYTLLLTYYLIFKGLIFYGKIGINWVRMRIYVYRVIELKHLEQRVNSYYQPKVAYDIGKPDSRAQQL